MRKHNPIPIFFRYILYGVVLIVTLYPLIFMLQTALKTPNAFANNFWLPSIKGFTLDNFYEVWINYQFYRFFTNSLIVSTVATVITVILSIMAGYAFAKHKFPFSDKLFSLTLSVMFVPVFVYIIPLFVQMRGVKLTNSLQSLILVYVFFGLPSGIYISRNSFYTLPREIREAGLVDGASYFRVFSHIAFPLAKPAISCIAILSFINNWGEYIWAIVSNTKDNVKTVPAALSYFTSMTNVFWWYQMAALSIAVVPIIIVYILFNKYFIRGFTEGAVKG